MSEESPKTVDTFEKKHRPIVLSEKVAPERLKQIKETVVEVDETTFEERIDEEERVELDWDNAIKKQKQNKWLYLTGGVIVVFFMCCTLWSLWSLVNAHGNDDAGLGAVGGLSFEEEADLRREVVEGYFEAKTWEERVQYVRNPDRVYPLMMEYYSKHPYQKKNTQGLDFATIPLPWKGKVVWSVRSKKGDVNLILENNSEGIPKVDWESEVIYQPTNWSEFISERSSDPRVFRVQLSESQLDGFHGFEFADYRKYRCYKISLPKTDEYLWGFTEKDSALDVQLLSLVSSSGNNESNNDREFPLTLELKFPPSAQSNLCVHISEVIEDGWMILSE